MPDAWMTIAEAATSLRVHTRTIERRIAGGKLQARRTEQGVLQVLMNVPDTPEPASDTAIDAVRELAADHVNLATGSASALVKFAQDDASRARDELVIVRQQATRAQRSAVTAWSLVGVCTVAVILATAWTSSKITQSADDVRHLTEYANQMKTASDKLETERDAARQQVVIADRTAAEASGRLAAYVEQNQKLTEMAARQRPTTGPAGLMQRLAEAMAR